MSGLSVMLISVGCGSSVQQSHTPGPDPETEEEKAARAERRELMAQKPETPWQLQSAKGYASQVGCSQGPFTLRTQAVGARHSERILVFACAKKEIAGRYRIVKDSTPPHTGKDNAFGFSQDNERCQASTEILSRAGQNSSESGQGGRTSSAAGQKRAENSANNSPFLVSGANIEKECGLGQSYTQVLDHSWSGVPLQAGTEIRIEIWSTKPNDFADARFVVRHQAVSTEMSDESWAELRDRQEKWRVRYMAFRDREILAGRTRLVEDVDKGTHGQPPAPKSETPPPQPSTNAAWTAGYWHWQSDWHWIAGWWKVPQEDVARQQTMQAPTAPPPPPVTRRAPGDVSADLVWVSGYWSWNEREWLWVQGRWGIPPRRGLRWRPAGWRKARGGAVFLPGGWSVRIGP